MAEELVRAEFHRDGGLNEYGRTLARIGLRAQQLETCLRMVEWGGVDTQGRGPCPACSRFPSQGHSEGCFLDSALQPHDAITAAEQAVQLAKTLLRHHSIESYLAGIAVTIQDINRVLDHAARTLEQL